MKILGMKSSWNKKWNRHNKQEQTYKEWIDEGRIKEAFIERNKEQWETARIENTK